MQSSLTPQEAPEKDEFAVALVTAVAVTRAGALYSTRLSYHWRIDGTRPEVTAADQHVPLVAQGNREGARAGAGSRELPVAATSLQPRIFDARIAPAGGSVGDTFHVVAEIGGPTRPQLSVQWMLDGNPIAGATSLRHTSTAEGRLTVHVTSKASGASQFEATSEPIMVLRPMLAPQINKLAVEPSTGPIETTFAAATEVTGEPAPELRYQWFLDGAPLAAATRSTLMASMPGELSVTVTAHNAGGQAERASLPASVVATSGSASPAGPPTLPDEANWTPANLSVKPVWFDASDLSGNESIGTWMDKLGGPAVADQPDAERRPKLLAGGRAGKPVLEFDGVDDTLAVHNAPQLAEGFSLFTVSRTRSLGTTRTIAARWGTGEDGDWILDTMPTEGRFLVRNKAFVYATMPVAQDTEYHIHGAVWTNGTAASFVDGMSSAIAASAPGSFSSASPLNLAARSSGSFSPLSLAEVILVPTALAKADRQNIEGYLARKWDLLSRLPADHPARKVSPGQPEPNPQPQPQPTAPEAWTPAEADALRGWLDATDASVLGAGAITTWRSRSGDLAATQTTPSCQPRLAQEGDRIVVRFDGVDDSMLLEGAPQPATGMTLIMVARTRSNDPGLPVNYVSNYAGANGDWILGPLGGFKSRLLVRTDNVNHSVTVGGAADTGFHIFGGTSFGGVSSAFCDGIVGPPVVHNLPPLSQNGVRLGARASGSASPIDICEVIFIAGPLSGQDRVRFEGYLAHKWNLAHLLPADHVFKSRPPLRGEAVAAPTGPAAPQADPWVAAGSLPSVSVPATVFVAPGATQVHIPITASGPTDFTAWTRVTGLQNISGGGFNVGGSETQATWIPKQDFYWRNGDDPTHWATIKINAPEAARNTAGNKFRVSFAGDGWANANVFKQQIGSTVVEVRQGAVNALPTEMPHHRAPKLISFPGTPATQLDIPGMQWSDNGYVGNPPLKAGTLLPVDPKAIPCWRARLYHGYAQAGNGELGAYLNSDAFPDDAVQPISKGKDSAGRPYARLHTRRLSRAVTVNGTAYNFQAAIINSQSMDQWSARTGVYRAQLKTPDRYGAWSAFWTFGRRTSTRGGAWPPEIDFFEHFNGAYGVGTGAADWNMSGTLTSAGQHCGPFGSNNRPRVEGVKTDLRRLGHANDVNLYSQIHDYACLITEDRIYHFIDGVETTSMPNMAKHEDPKNTDWDYAIYLNVAVKPSSSGAAYTDGSGDMLIYGLQRYEPNAGYVLGEWTAPAPWPNRAMLPNPD